MRLPKSFNEITISQFQECYFINKSDPTLEGWSRIISILSRESIETVQNLPIDRIKQLKKLLLFILDDQSLNEKVKQWVYINKKIYKPVTELNKLSTAQAIDIKTFIKPQEGMDYKDIVVENAHKLLASIYLPLKGFSFKYDGANHQKASEDFRHAKMGEVYGTLFFYSAVWENWMKSLEPYGKQAAQTIESHMEDVISWANTETTGDGK